MSEKQYYAKEKWVKKPKHYRLTGFKLKKDLELRAGEMIKASQMQIIGAGCIDDGNWFLDITENHLPFLNENENQNNRLIELPRSIAIRQYSPTLYRFMENEYVDSFFKDGSMRLSSFRQFRTLPDENRKDAKEGRSVVLGDLGNGTKLEIDIGVGSEAFVLCSSMNYDDKSFYEGKNSCIVIDRIQEFVLIVSKALSDVMKITMGPCYYTNASKIIKNTSNIDIDQIYNKEKKTFDVRKAMDAAYAVAGDDVYFKKHTDYSPEHEYRVLWHIDQEKIPEYIDIKIPEAIKFCRKIDINSAIG